jgi:hypothetical protein
MKLEELLELGRRYGMVREIAHPDEEVEVKIDRYRSRRPGFITYFGGEPISAMSLDAVISRTDNPALLSDCFDVLDPSEHSEYRFYQHPVVKAMQERPWVFDWLNPRDTDRLIKEALERHWHNVEINRRARGQSIDFETREFVPRRSDA